MLRDYELVVVVRPNVEEEGLSAILEKVKGWIGSDGGTVTRVDHWGRRRLAYPINKEREGLYILVLARLEPAQVGKVERNLGLTEEILRFLFVRIEPEPQGEAKPEAAA